MQNEADKKLEELILHLGDLDDDWTMETNRILTSLKSGERDWLLDESPNIGLDSMILNKR